MPPVSEKQRRLMWAVSNSPAVAKKTGIPQKVGKEFAQTDPGGKLPKRAPKKKGSKP